MTPEVAKSLSIAEQHEWFQQRRSRRTLLKGGIAGAGSLLVGSALLDERSLAGAAAPAEARTSPTLLRSIIPANGSGIAPFGRHLSFGSNPQTEVNVCWQVANPVQNPFIRIGTLPGQLSQQIAASVETVTTPWADITDFVDSVPPSLSAAKAPTEQYYVHAALTGLEPGQTYYYVGRPPGPRSLASHGITPGGDHQLHHGPGTAGALHLHRLRRPGHHLRRRRHHQPDPGPVPRLPPPRR